MAILLSGSMNAVNQTAPAEVYGPANLLLAFSGADAAIEVQRSFDNGATWYTVSADNAGNPACYRHDVNLVFDEPEQGVKYRIACTEHTSGTVMYRISQ